MNKETMETGAPVMICATSSTQVLLMIEMETSALMLVTVLMALTSIQKVSGAQTSEIANAITRPPTAILLNCALKKPTITA
jgi:hypothetical protein